MPRIAKEQAAEQRFTFPEKKTPEKGKKAAETSPQTEETQEQQEQQEIDARSGTVVLTKEGLPDMRIAENRERFLLDKSRRLNGHRDFRLIENRPDLQEIHRRRGDNRPNVIFRVDGTLKTAEEVEELARRMD